MDILDFICIIIIPIVLFCNIFQARDRIKTYRDILATGVSGYGTVIDCKRKVWWWWNLGITLFLPRYILIIEFYLDGRRYELQAFGYFRNHFAKQTTQLYETVPIVYSTQYPTDVVVTSDEVFAKNQYWDMAVSAILFLLVAWLLIYLFN